MSLPISNSPGSSPQVKNHGLLQVTGAGRTVLQLYQRCEKKENEFVEGKTRHTDDDVQREVYSR